MMSAADQDGQSVGGKKMTGAKPRIPCQTIPEGHGIASTAAVGAPQIDQTIKPKGLVNKPAKRRRTAPFANSDQRLVEEMHQLLTIKPPKATSPWDATDLVADRAKGGGSRDS